MSEARPSQNSPNAEIAAADSRRAPGEDPTRDALELAGAGRYVEAERILSLAIKENPRNGYLLNARGAVLSGRGRELDAALSFKEAIERCGDVRNGPSALPALS